MEQEEEAQLTGFPAKERTREMACQLQVNMEVVKEAEKRIVLSLAITWPVMKYSMARNKLIWPKSGGRIFSTC